MKNLRSEEENIIKNIRNLFRLGKETKEVKDKRLRDIENLFEEYYKPVTVNNFGVIIILNIKVTTIPVKHYQLKNILIKLDHI